MIVVTRFRVPTSEATAFRVDLEEITSGTRMRLTSSFATAEQMEQLVGMGMVEGMTGALGQIDALLAA